MEKDIKATNEKTYTMVAGEVVNIMVPSLLAVPLHASIDTEGKMKDLVRIHTSEFMFTPKLTSEYQVNTNMLASITMSHQLIKNNELYYRELMDVTSTLVSMYHEFDMIVAGRSVLPKLVHLAQDVLSGHVLFVITDEKAREDFYNFYNNCGYNSIRTVGDDNETHLKFIKSTFALSNSGYLGQLRLGMTPVSSSLIIPVLISEGDSYVDDVKRLGLDIAQTVIILK